MAVKTEDAEDPAPASMLAAPFAHLLLLPSRRVALRSGYDLRLTITESNLRMRVVRVSCLLRTRDDGWLGLSDMRLCIMHKPSVGTTANQTKKLVPSEQNVGTVSIPHRDRQLDSPLIKLPIGTISHGNRQFQHSSF
jgi:hypothetical protein